VGVGGGGGGGGVGGGGGGGWGGGPPHPPAALRALIASFRPDVVHSHTSKAGFVARPVARAAGVPVVAHTFHGHVLRDYFPALVSALLARRERRLAAVTDLLFAVSASCADELAAAGVAARERFAVVPPAVPLPPPLPRAAAASTLGIAVPERHLVCVGRLVPIKRVDHFVRAVAAMPGWSGDIVGDGPERGRLQLLAERQANSRIRFLGARPDIGRQLAGYAALVLPSRREGLPLVAVEAFAAGVPVVGYDVPGVRDALACYGPATAVPPAAGPAGLAAAILGLEVGNLRDRLATAGIAAAARFAPAAVAAALHSAYIAARTRYHPAVPH
jgi:glycosyltransferase involved in cell wall biosynthesis